LLTPFTPTVEIRASNALLLFVLYPKERPGDQTVTKLKTSVQALRFTVARWTGHRSAVL
jgi:hypothetical protein